MPEPDPALLDAVRGVALAARRIERRLDALRPDSMSLAQLRVLMLVARDPMRANALAHGAALSRPTLTGLLDALAAKGWLDRCAVDGDRRGVELAITEQGRLALAAAQQHATDALDELLDELEPDERAHTVAALGSLAAVAQRQLARRLGEDAR